MHRIRLNARELQKIYDMFQTMNESSDYGSITLESSNENEIGSVLKATMYVTHKDVEGDFTVTITDESDW